MFIDIFGTLIKEGIINATSIDRNISSDPYQQEEYFKKQIEEQIFIIASIYLKNTGISTNYTINVKVLKEIIKINNKTIDEFIQNFTNNSNVSPEIKEILK